MAKKKDKNLVRWARSRRRREALDSLQKAYADRMFVSTCDESTLYKWQHVRMTKEEELIRIQTAIDKLEEWLNEHPLI